MDRAPMSILFYYSKQNGFWFFYAGPEWHSQRTNEAPYVCQKSIDWKEALSYLKCSSKLSTVFACNMAVKGTDWNNS